MFGERPASRDMHSQTGHGIWKLERQNACIAFCRHIGGERISCGPPLSELRDGTEPGKRFHTFHEALFKFQFVIPMVLIFLFLGKWKVIRGFLGMASVLGILSFVAVGWAGLANYVHLLTAIASQPDNSSFGAAVDMATVQGFVHAVLGRVLNHVTVSLIVSLISGLLIVSTAWQWKRATHSGLDKADDVMFGAAIIVSLVTGLHMFTHDLSPLILAMLVVLPNVVESRGTLPRVLTGCLILLWIPPLYFALLASHHIYLLFPLLLFLKVGLMKIVVLPQRTSFPLTGVRHLREAT